MDAQVRQDTPKDPGRRKRPRRTPKGRQLEPRAVEEVQALLGQRERRAGGSGGGGHAASRGQIICDAARVARARW